MMSTRTYLAPGRINLIGEHTDYNHGYVLPGAVDMHLLFEVTPNSNGHFEFYSKHFEEKDSCDIKGEGLNKRWSVFFGQVIRLMDIKGHKLIPVNCSFDGNLPVGAGMSSSSALTCGLIFALNDINDLGLTRLEMMYLASEAERGSGLDGGKMDQYSILFGEDNSLLLLDCQSYEHRLIDVDLEDYTIALFDTRVTHDLIDSGYNDRHADCKRGLRQLQTLFPTLKNMREITQSHLDEGDALLDDISRKRLHYVFLENKRVLRLIAALEQRDLNQMGALLYETHKGLRYDYEVSCAELDFIVDWSKTRSEILGARMMGGGFGGCVIALIQKDQYTTSFEALNQLYSAEFGIDAAMHKITLSKGVHRVS